jgi:hypothetical protein
VFAGLSLFAGGNNSLVVGQLSCLDSIFCEATIESSGHADDMFPCWSIEFQRSEVCSPFNIVVSSIHCWSFNWGGIQLRIVERMDENRGWFSGWSFDRRGNRNTSEDFLRVERMKART